VRTPALILAATLLAAVRVAGHRSPAFQAVAHLYVGGLLGAWAATHRAAPLLLAAALSAVEIACFFFLPR
jgi:hypothetical protein